jgi:selenocysteine lyase/cysteine desulfurase
MPAAALDPDLVPPVAGGLLGAAAQLVGARPGDAVLLRADHAAVVRLLSRAIGLGPDDVVVVGSAWPGRDDAAGDPAGRLPDRAVDLGATLAGTVAAVVDELTRRPARLLVVPGAHPVTGELLPLAELADLAHAHGARIAVEAGPLVAAGAVDMAAADLDHVLYGGLDVHAPLATAVLVSRPAPSAGSPAGSGAGSAAGSFGGSSYRQPDRLGARPPHPRRAVPAALAAACRELAALPEGLLAAHEDDLRRLVLATLRRLPGVHPVPGWPDARRHCGVVSFRVDGHDASSVSEHLTVRHGLPGVDTVVLPQGPRPASAADGGAVGAVRLRLDAAWAPDDVTRLRDALEDVLTS